MEQEKVKSDIIGKCPVCGGDVVRTSYGYTCSNALSDRKNCGFSIRRQQSCITLDDGLMKELLQYGQTGILRLKNKLGQSFRGTLFIDGQQVNVRPEIHCLKGRCPVCGGKVIRTGKGYACENALKGEPTCDFHALGILARRKITEDEMEAFLDGRDDILDGFSSNVGKVFSGILRLNASHTLRVDSHVCHCPYCGGNLLIGIRNFNCENYNNPGHACKTSLWRHVMGHEITAEEITQICEKGITDEPVELIRPNGQVFLAHLGLDKEKCQIIKIEKDEQE
jgi:hypothetical protein